MNTPSWSDVPSHVMTRSELVDGLGNLGGETLRDSVVLAHVRMSAIGWVVGGAPTIIEALLETVGPGGTVVTLTGWEDRPPYHQQGWPAEMRAAYERGCPPFDPVLSRSERSLGRFAETVRTWPSAQRSRHPVGSFAAVGAQAVSVVGGQDIDQGYGVGSPLERLVEADGLVLLLGAPLDSTTVLHYAEYLAKVPNKRWHEYHMPIVEDGDRRWRRIRELDSSLGAFPYEQLEFSVDAFEMIVREALATGIGVSATVGAAPAHLIPGARLVDCAVAWMEKQFAP